MGRYDQESVKHHETSAGAGLRPVLGFRDLVLFYIVAIFGVRLLPVSAAAGPSIMVYFMISLVIFFIPLGLTVTDLAKRYPGEGGIYIWSKKAFGDFENGDKVSESELINSKDDENYYEESDKETCYECIDNKNYHKNLTTRSCEKCGKPLCKDCGGEKMLCYVCRFEYCRNCGVPLYSGMYCSWCDD